MILCLDIGNSRIYGGVFKDNKLILQFRKQSKNESSTDEFGLFLRSVLKENNIKTKEIISISMCTVVPEALHPLKNCCIKYFNINPFILEAGTKTGLQIKYKNPIEVGADRIANSVAAVNMYPNTNIIIIDFGTATTFCAINKNKEYLGGSILSGIKISMKSLESNTSKLPSVEITAPKNTLGKSTVENIQSGLYYGHLGAVREITKNLKKEAFNNDSAIIIGTGGFSGIFREKNIFDKEVQDLVLIGLYFALQKNTQTTKIRNYNERRSHAIQNS